MESRLHSGLETSMLLLLLSMLRGKLRYQDLNEKNLREDLCTHVSRMFNMPPKICPDYLHETGVSARAISRPF